MWPASQDGDRRGARLGAAFALSLLCHALALLVAPGWRSESRLAPPIIVTMVDRGSGHDGGNGSDALAAAPEPMTAPAPVVPVAKKAAPRRVAPTRRAVPGRASRTETTTALVAADPSPVGAAGDGAVARAGSGAVGAGNDGGGLGSGGHGNGGGAGAGSDGLRVFCRDCPTPDYPGRARRQGWQGTVDVELAIGRDGAVEAARVGRSSGYPTLDEVALEVVRRSRFVVPAGGNGLRGQLRYRFVLDETAARR